MDHLDCHKVLTMLGKKADGALRTASGDAWHCERAIPRIDGSLYFDLKNTQAEARLDWFGPVSTDDFEGMALTSQNTGELALGDLVMRSMAQLIVEVQTEPDYSLLWFCNQERMHLRFDDQVVDTLLADRFGPLSTRWFAYQFKDAFQDSSNAFQLSFSGPSGELVFEIRQAGAGTSSQPVERVLSNQLFSLEIIDDPRSPDQRRLLPHQVERFLGFLLCRAIHPGMRLQRAPAPILRDGAGPDNLSTADGDPGTGPRPNRGQDAFDGAPISTSRWGNPKQWYQFFSDFEVERSSLCSVRFTDPLAYVVHGEMECRGIEPNLFGKRVDFANSPWPQEPPLEVPGSEGRFTGLVDQDAILGGTAKLEQALEKAILNPKIRMVCLNNTCLPKIIGDDVSSVVARVAKHSPVPILSMNTDLDSPDAAFSDLVRQARDAAGQADPNRKKGGLNLIGFPPGQGRRDLVRQLQEIGIQVNCLLIPEFGVEDMRTYAAGSCGLLYPFAPWIQLTERILGDLEVPFEAHVAPYGFEGCRSWFEAAAAMLGRSDSFALWQKRFYEPAMEGFEELSARNKGRRLGFVVDPGSFARLFEPERMYGFALAQMLEEMGFGLDVLLLWDGVGAQNQARFFKALQDPDRHTVTNFEDSLQLDDLLSKGEFSAVYSEVFFDRRLTRAGKSQFNLGMFELGLDGAMRGLERLIALCEWPFYRRYGEYLTATAKQT